MARDTYTDEEDWFILHYMRGVDKRVHREVLKRCQYIHDNFLPNRSPEAIRDHWRHLTGDRDYGRAFAADIKDLLSEDQRKRVKLHIPVKGSKVRKIEGQ